MRLWLTALLMAALALVFPARADELRPSYLELTQQNARIWQVKLKAPLKGSAASKVAPALPSSCLLGSPRRDVREGSLTSFWRADCSETLVGKRVGLSGLESTLSDGFVRIAPLGRPVQAAHLTPTAPMAEVAARAGTTQVAQTYFILGVEHILAGYDHLLFVLSLVLLLSGIGLIVRTVTAFTVAHSITLVGATLGFLGVSQKPVEICIALSIVFLAVEVAKRDPAQPRLSERAPWFVAFLFGLIHGFGFAGALAQIGLPEGEVPVALLTFNVGVEAGQVSIVLAAMGLLALIERLTASTLAKFKGAAAYAIGITASAWLIARAVA